MYKGHNSQITFTPCNQLALYNCQVKGECPMDGKCQTMEAICDCRVLSPEPQKIFFELAEEKWKERYHNHKKSFNHKRYSRETTLSGYVWCLKGTLDVTPKLKSAPCYTQTSQKSVFCVCMKIWLLLPIQDNTTFK